MSQCQEQGLRESPVKTLRTLTLDLCAWLGSSWLNSVRIYNAVPLSSHHHHPLLCLLNFATLVDISIPIITHFEREESPLTASPGWNTVCSNGSQTPPVRFPFQKTDHQRHQGTLGDIGCWHVPWPSFTESITPELYKMVVALGSLLQFKYKELLLH